MLYCHVMAKRNSFSMRMADTTQMQLATVADTFGVARTKVIEILIETAYVKLQRQLQAQNQPETDDDGGPTPEPSPTGDPAADVRDEG